VRMVILLFLILLPIGGMAQTIRILSIFVNKEPQLGARPIDVEVSMSNDTKVPIVLNNRFFYLQDDTEAVYSSLSRRNNSDISFNVQLVPGSKISQRLWFEVPKALDLQNLSLCLHASENTSWDDYLEISFALPVPATAPMWHLARPGDPMDPLAYVDPMKYANPSLGPPKLFRAPDPEFPPGGAQHVKEARGKIVSVLSVIIDRKGYPQQVQVVRAAGNGFDEEAMKAVKQYRFKPAMDRNGQPVAVKVRVEVNFRVP
jgi:TonB family protein